MSDEETAPEWAKAEIKEAIRILKEDGMHVHRTYQAFLKSDAVTKRSEEGEKLSEAGEKLSGEEDDTTGNPPPEKKEEKQNDKPKKKGVWWGDRNE